MTRRRLVRGAVALVVAAGAVMVGPAAQAATYLHGPYKTLAECTKVRAEVARHATVGDCFAWPRRGYHFYASS